MAIGPRGTPELPRPALQAMLLADHAIREADTGKVTLVGVFDRISSPTFPVEWTHQVNVYARVNDAEGRYPVRLELVRLEDEAAIGRLDGTAVIENRLNPTELVFTFGSIVFDRPGTHEFSLFANLLFVGSARLFVVQSGQPQGGSP